MRNPNCQYDWYRSMFEGPPRTTDAFVREMEGKVRYRVVLVAPPANE